MIKEGLTDLQPVYDPSHTRGDNTHCLDCITHSQCRVLPYVTGYTLDSNDIKPWVVKKSSTVTDCVAEAE